MRTTFKTRYDKRVRKDEQIVEESFELCQPLSDEKLVHIVEDESHSCFEFCNRKLCPQSTIEESQENQMEKHTNKLSMLEQSTGQKIILYLNLLLIVILAIFLYVYMSINPFTADQISEFEIVIRNKTLLSEF